MNCPHCKYANQTGQKFCGECGLRLPTGPVLDAEALIAQSAKSYTPPHLADQILESRSVLEGERKQVTVLFCDIADSTPMAERLGAERMHAVLNAFFEMALTQVHRFEGTLNQFLGDGFMALFGAPITHEDHARRAVLAAIAIRDEVAARWAENGLPEGFQIRLGLNTGLVVLGKIGDNLRMEYTAIGDTTNVAARLQGQAERGEVVCSESVARTVETFIECKPLGLRALKGKVEPMQVFQVLRPWTRAHQSAEAMTPLLGRHAEMMNVRSAIDAVHAGTGGILAIVGEAGLGKSRLLGEARRYSREQDVRWVEGTSLSFGSTLSYWPFREVLRQCVGIDEEDSEQQSWAKLHGRMSGLFGQEAGDELAPYIGVLLALNIPEPFSERTRSLDGLSMGRQIYRCTLKLFERLGQERPLIIAFEDWHWADASSAELLEHLLSLALSVPILFIVASRPEQQGAMARFRQSVSAGGPFDAHFRELALTPLAPDQATQLIGSLLGAGTLPSKVRELLLQRSAGNPFYLGELVRTLQATHAIERNAKTGDWTVATQFDTLPLPNTIEGVILARVDRLDEDAKQLLKTAAVVGRTFFYRVLKAVTEGEAALDSDLANLMNAAFIDEKLRAPELEYMFKHPLIQQASYDSLLEGRRRQLHRRVGEAIEQLFDSRLDQFYSVLAYHYAQAEHWPKAQEYLLKAADHAGAMSADEEALELYHRALAASEKSPTGQMSRLQRAALDCKIGEALFRIGHDTAPRYLLGALAQLGRPYPKSQRGVSLAILARLAKLMLRGMGKALRRGSAAESGKQPDEEFLLVSRVLLAMTYIDFHSDPARYVLDILMQVEESASFPRSTGFAVSNAGLGLLFDSLGFYRIGAACHRQASRASESLGQQFPIAVCEQMRGFHEYAVGDWAAALKTFNRNAERFDAIGDLHLWLITSSCRDLVLRSMGLPDWGKWLDKQLEVAASTQDAQGLGWATNMAGFWCQYRGDLMAAASRYEEAARLLEGVSDVRIMVNAKASWALCLAKLGRPDQALSVLSHCRRVVSEFQIGGLFATTYVVNAAEAYLCVAQHPRDEQQRGQALALAKHACARLRRHGRSVHDDSRAEGLRLDGIYAHLTGDSVGAKRLWSEGIKVAETIGANYVLAKIHHEMGVRLNDPFHADLAKTLFAKTGSNVFAD